MPKNIDAFGSLDFGQATFKDGRVQIAQKMDGLDINAILTGLRTEMLKTAEPFELEIQSKKEKELPTFEKIRTATLAVQRKANELKNYLGVAPIPNVFTAKEFTEVTNDGSARILIQNGAKANEGEVELKVIQKARYDRVLSDGGHYLSGPSQVILPSLEEGSTQKLIVNGVAIPITNKTTIAELVEGIKSAPAGVKADLVRINEGQYQLCLTASTMAKPITLEDDQGGSLLTSGLFLPTTPTDAERLQALFTYNGMTITRPTNIITDVAPGLTLELMGLSTTGVSGSITNDYTGVFATIKQFVSLYNAAYKDVAKQLEIDAEGNPAKTAYLHGLSSMVSIHDLYKKGITDYKGLSYSTDLTSLSRIGITTEKDGTLAITDDATLLNHIKTNFEGVRKLFGDYATSSSALFQVRALPTNMNKLAGKNIEITFSNTGGGLTATLSCPDAGIAPETISLTNKIVDGNSTINFKGLLLQYTGSGAVGTSDNTTLVCTQGIAATFYDSIKTATQVSDGTSAATKSLFELTNQEILNGIERAQERIDRITASVDTRIKAMQGRTGKLYDAFNRATAASQLLQTLYSDR